MADPIRRLESRIRESALTLYRARHDRGTITAAITDLLRQDKLDERLQREMQAQIERDLDWVRNRTLDAGTRSDIASVLGRSAQQFATVVGGLQQDVATAVTRAIRDGVETKELVDLLASTFRKRRDHAETIAATATAAFDRIDTFRQAREAGVTSFRLVGPPPERLWCIIHYEQVYTLEEIARMDNGQGLPVKEYCGGWHCHHTWEAVIDESATLIGDRVPRSEILRRLPIVRAEHHLPNLSASSTRPLTGARLEIDAQDEQIRRVFTRALKMIRSVHGLPDDLPQLRLRWMQRMDLGGEYIATFTRDHRRHIPEIRVNSERAYQETHIQHEFAHFLDDAHFGRNRFSFGSERSGVLDDWKASIDASERVADLRRARSKGKTSIVAGGRDVTIWVEELAAYMLRRSELWARSYAQWIARKTGNSLALSQHQRWEAGRPIADLWTDDDFRPIHAALDDLFISQGLMEHSR